MTCAAMLSETRQFRVLEEMTSVKDKEEATRVCLSSLHLSSSTTPLEAGHALFIEDTFGCS
jgi:hypothetical protein